MTPTIKAKGEGEKITTMKYKALVVAMQNKQGDFWQVALTPGQQEMVVSLIGQLHGGSIKILHNKLPLTFDK